MSVYAARPANAAPTDDDGFPPAWTANPVVVNPPGWDEYRMLNCAIRERQDVAQVAAGNKLSTDTTQYTIAQYITAVNEIATYFINGTYAGGASAPAVAGATYADGATTIAGLGALVVALMSSTHTISSGTSHSFYQGTDTQAVEATAQANAESAYPSEITGSAEPLECWAAVSRDPPGSGNYTTLMRFDPGRFVVSSLYADRARYGTVWVKPQQTITEIEALSPTYDATYNYGAQLCLDGPGGSAELTQDEWSAYLTQDSDNWDKGTSWDSNAHITRSRLVLAGTQWHYAWWGSPDYPVTWQPHAGTTNYYVKGFDCPWPNYLTLNWLFRWQATWPTHV